MGMDLAQQMRRENYHDEASQNHGFALGLGLLATGLNTITSSPVSPVGTAPVNITQVSVPSVPVSGTVSVSNDSSRMTG
jgi:hypothetical protein